MSFRKKSKLKPQRALFAMLGLGLLLTVGHAGEQPEPADEVETISYSIGYRVGGDFAQQGLSVNPEMVIRGVLDALAGSESLMTEEEMERALITMQRHAEAGGERRSLELAQRNLKQGTAFLAENAKRAGVRTLPSGLQYRIIEEGTGPTPGASDTVTVHYRGTLIDGSEFDSSYHRDEPATFRVDRVIAGWGEALQLMKEGAKYELYIPWELAYGKRGPLAFQAIIFEVELLEVNPEDSKPVGANGNPN